MAIACLPLLLGSVSYGRHATVLVPGYEQLCCVCRRTVRHWHRCSTAPNLILSRPFRRVLFLEWTTTCIFQRLMDRARCRVRKLPRQVDIAKRDCSAV